MEKRRRWRLVRDFGLELILYAILVVAYSVVVLRLLSGLLARLFHGDPVAYAFIGLGLIVAQGIVLDAITTFLLDRLKPGQLD